ncbi:MAG: glycosyltransferase family 4 protein [Acidimicrobiales bacterium]
MAPVPAVGRDARLRVALDATPLLGTRTGVAAFCAGALGGLAARSDLAVSAYAVSWRRRRGIVGHLPAQVTAIDRPLPARPLHWAWQRSDFPAVDWLLGPMDVVHGTNFVVPPARRAARVVTVHDLTAIRFPEMCQPASLAFPGLVRRAAARGAWVHTPSAWVASEVVELLGIDPERVRAVHHGVPASDQPAPRQPAPGGPAPRQPAPGSPPLLPPGTGRYILALGTVEPRKDLPGLVRAFDQLAGDHPDLALVVAGADGWGSGALTEAVAASPFGERILRLGYVAAEERDPLLAGAAVFAYPSVYEGFGLPPLEAMACGVPVVATSAGALPEVLGDGATLVGVGDAAGLAWALEHLLTDDRARAGLVRRGAARVAGLSWSDCAGGLARLYRDAVSARAS